VTNIWPSNTSQQSSISIITKCSPWSRRAWNKTLKPVTLCWWDNRNPWQAAHTSAFSWSLFPCGCNGNKNPCFCLPTIKNYEICPLMGIIGCHSSVTFYHHCSCFVSPCCLTNGLLLHYNRNPPITDLIVFAFKKKLKHFKIFCVFKFKLIFFVYIFISF